MLFSQQHVSCLPEILKTIKTQTAFHHICLQALKENNVSLPGKIDSIMNRWVLQMGFPVVTIDTATGSVSQKHFLLDPEANVTVTSPYKYAPL